MSLKLRVYGLVSAGLAVAISAFFAAGYLNTGQAAGSSNPAPKVNVLAASLTVTPTSGVPNQTIVITGSGFTSATTAGGAGPNGVHQITGTGVSFITVSGISLGSPNATYPINLDTSGGFVTTVVIPVTDATLSAGSINIAATDDKVVAATTTFTTVSRTITLAPTSSRRGTTVTATGTGFPASNPGATGSFGVQINYAGTQVADAVPDSSGNFEITFKVPVGAVIPSSNTVTASVVGKTATATATHSVPSASITLAPTEGSAGSSATVTASNFPAFAPVTSITLGSVQVLPSPGPNTDGEGAFSSNILVPGLPTGNQVVIATVGGITATSTFKITASLIAPTATPIPTPTPGPISEATSGLAPLLNAANLLRVWHFNNSTKSWTFFDPRPAFASANTIINMATGEVYWINVFGDQTVTLNSQQRILTAGWNLLSW